MGWPTTFTTLIETEKDRGLVEIVRELAESWCLKCNGNMVEASRVLESPPRGHMVEPALEHLGQVHRVFSIDPSFEATANTTGSIANATGCRIRDSQSDVGLKQVLQQISNSKPNCYGG